MRKIKILTILSLIFTTISFLILGIFFSVIPNPFSVYPTGIEIVLESIIFFLFIVSPFIALISSTILLIFLIKRKESNKLLLVLALVGFIIGWGMSSYILIEIFHKPPPYKDPKRESDMRQISLAMEMDYDDNGHYLQSQFMPISIGKNYLDPVPIDPGYGPCSSYQWISNMDDPYEYCTWACLQDGRFFAASYKGTKKLDEAPINLDCW